MSPPHTRLVARAVLLAGVRRWVRLGCPSVIVRRFDITIVGNAPPPNNNVVRQIDVSVRPRNDEIPIPNCPTEAAPPACP